MMAQPTEREAEIVALVRSGMTQREVAKKFKLRNQTVGAIIATFAPDLTRRKYTAADLEQVLALFDEGHSLAGISGRLGICEERVTRMVRAHREQEVIKRQRARARAALSSRHRASRERKKYNDALAAAILGDMAPPRATSLGYVRCSPGQDSGEQARAVRKAGAIRVFVDSGPKDDGLAALLDYAREGDTVTVVALDRLGRSLSGIVRTVETLQQRGINLRSLREGIDYSTPVGRMVAGIFASLAEYERTLINERAAAAREASRDKGAKLGRKPVLTPEQVAEAKRMRDGGETIATITSRLGASRATVYRALGNG